MKKILTFLFVIVLGIVSVNAVPAYPNPIKFKQPDGAIVTVFVKGDEKVHWRETLDGYTLVFNKDGYLTYAIKDANGDLQSSNVVVTEIEDRDIVANSLLQGISKREFYSESQVSILLQVWSAYKETTSKIERKGSLIGGYKAVCVLAQFPEKQLIHSKSDFENLMNGIGYNGYGASGSVKEFFLETSYNQFNLTIEIVGPYTTPESELYYAGANGSARCNMLAKWLAMEADKDIDYSECDNDEDGVVDNFHFIFAGYGQESGVKDVIWSHSWAFDEITLDGKKLSRYSCSPELNGNSGDTITAIGVIGHEISHAFGSGDYYDTDYARGGQFDGTGNWDVMAGGNWNNEGNTPAHHNLYEKIKFGWIKEEMLSKKATVTNMPSSTFNPIAYRVNTTTPNEYFLIENRQNTNFNSYVPGHGLLICRVHSEIETYINYNSVNTHHPLRYYPVCASSDVAIPNSKEKSYGVINGDGCTFPGSTNNREFTDSSTPSMQSWAGQNSNKPITNIVEDGDFISFDFMGGGDEVTYFPVTIISFGNGAIKVRSNDRIVISDTYLKNGSEIVITALPDDGYELKELKINNKTIEGNTAVINEETIISATFRVGTGVINVVNSNTKIISNDNTIQIYNSDERSLDVQVIDISGAIIKQIVMNNGEGNICVPKSGIYIVKVNDGLNVVYRKIIVK